MTGLFLSLLTIISISAQETTLQKSPLKDLPPATGFITNGAPLNNYQKRLIRSHAKYTLCGGVEAQFTTGNANQYYANQGSAVPEIITIHDLTANAIVTVSDPNRVRVITSHQCEASSETDNYY